MTGKPGLFPSLRRYSSLVQGDLMADRQDLDRIRREYHDQGFSVVGGLFSADECLALQKIAECLPSFISGTLLPVMNPHRDRPELLSAMGDERVMTIVRQLMDGTPLGLQTQYFFCRPGTRGFSAHQDNYYVRAPQNKFVSAWLALEDVETENGALIVWPGSHREPILEVRDIPQPSTFGQDANHNRQECVTENQYPARQRRGAPRWRGIPAQPRDPFVERQRHVRPVPPRPSNDLSGGGGRFPARPHRQAPAIHRHRLGRMPSPTGSPGDLGHVSRFPDTSICGAVGVGHTSSRTRRPR
jgi:hypothetical protein